MRGTGFRDVVQKKPPGMTAGGTVPGTRGRAGSSRTGPAGASWNKPRAGRGTGARDGTAAKVPGLPVRPDLRRSIELERFSASGITRGPPVTGGAAARGPDFGLWKGKVYYFLYTRYVGWVRNTYNPLPDNGCRWHSGA